MYGFRELIFECPACGKKHNVRAWLNDCVSGGLAVMDTAFTEGEFLTYGGLCVYYAGVQCACGKDYSVHAKQNVLEIYDGSEIVFCEEYSEGC